MATLPSALFVAAGGYHHHLGLNTWRGEGVGPAPPDTVGLREWTVVVDPDALAPLGLSAGEVVADPWGTALRFAAG